MIPEIVVRKIWWYEWKIKQREICEEYIERYYYGYGYGYGESIVMKKGNLSAYNWRNLSGLMEDYNTYIYDCKNFSNKKVGELPKNYRYSKGD